jgi:predicted Abi (CAAX) family protease
LGFRPPPPEDGHDLNYDLLLAGLPADPRVAWLRLNRGSFTVRRILALLRLGTHAIRFYHRAPEVDRPPAFVITFGVLGVSGCFVALEPDADVAGFFLP